MRANLHMHVHVCARLCMRAHDCVRACHTVARSCLREMIRPIVNCN